MVAKKKTEKRGKAKASKLKLSKETLKDLTDSEAQKIQGGVLAAPKRVDNTTPTGLTCTSNPGCGPGVFC